MLVEGVFIVETLAELMREGLGVFDGAGLEGGVEFGRWGLAEKLVEVYLHLHLYY